MSARGWLALLVGAALVSLGAGVGFKRDPFGGPLVPGMSGATGNDQTLDFIYSLKQFVDPGAFTARLWVDPYSGNDVTGDGSYGLPFKSFARLKEVCLSNSGMRCTIKGLNKVFSPLTFVVDGVALGDQFLRGEALSWAAGASTGTVLDWDPTTNTLVIARLTGTDPDCCAVTFIGTTSLANVTDVSRADTVGGHPTERVTSFTDIGDIVGATGHYYVNGQGPMRFFSGANDLPAGLTEGTDYYICDVVAGVSFTVDTDQPCAGASVVFGASASVTTDITGFSNTNVIATISPNCGAAKRDGICTMLESEFSESPAMIDVNGFNPLGLSYVAASGDYWPGDFPSGGFLIAGGTGNGWLAVQNVTVQNIALDAFSTVSGAGSTGKLVTLNSPAKNVRNGTSDRSTVLAATSHNSCFSSTGGDGATQGGVLIALNANESNNDSDSPIASGAPINPNEESRMILIGTGTIGNQAVAANSSPDIQMPSGQLTVLGHTLRTTTGANFAPIQQMNGGAASVVWGVHFARVLMHLRTSFANNYALQYTATIGAMFATLDEVTLRVTDPATQDFIDLASFSAGGTGVFTLRNVLVDNINIWIIAEAGAAAVETNFTETTMNWTRSSFDDEEGGADATENEWTINPTSYTTLALFQAAVDALTGDQSWNVMEDAASFNSGGDGVDGNQLGTDVAFRCLTGQTCFQANGPAYAVPLTTIYGPDPDDSCLPAGVLGSRLCSLNLIPTHIGAR